jgi:omega-6 fatty acid desaturase (delta-12 desaturase)
MYWSLGISYWLTMALAVPTAGFLVRAFILFHDCCHGSFFKSRAANETLGVFLGVLVLTPYYHWRRDHAVHHATAGNLDKRGVGDVKTWTVQEYAAAPWRKRVGYRIMRNPLIMFTFGASLVFLVFHRLWRPGAGRRERLSVVYTDLALLSLFLILGFWLGYLEILVVQVTIMAVASAAGVWLFYVQHQFEGVYWERKDRWNFVLAGLQGSSFYKLPKILNWFSGNIGFHHIHHLSPKIPNYFLETCHHKNPALQVKPLTILGSLKSARLRLWDEGTQQLVGFDVLQKNHPQMIQ